MRKLPRVRERTATLQELDEDRRRRCLAAQAKPATPAREGNLCAVLVRFARWRRCSVCSRDLLFVDAECRASGDVECPACRRNREKLAKRLRQALVRQGVRHHLAPLFSPTKDNALVLE